MNHVLWSSNGDEWYTPYDLYEQLNDEFNFTLDPCATIENHKASKYYTIEDDGLKKSWNNEIVFCNPPYSNIKNWVEKAYFESMNCIVVMLIPARTDTRYFHDYIYKKDGVEIRFLKGRLKFGGNKNSAPFPSMIVIFNRKDDKTCIQ